MKYNYEHSSSNKSLIETINFITPKMNKHINRIKKYNSFSIKPPMEIEYIKQCNEEKIKFLDESVNNERINRIISKNYKKHIPFIEEVQEIEKIQKTLKDLDRLFFSFFRWYVNKKPSGMIFDQEFKFWYSNNIDFEGIMSNAIKTSNNFKTELSKFVHDMKTEYFIARKGLEGENKIINKIGLYNHNHIILRNINIKFMGKNCEHDMIIISDKGLYSIEVKNFGQEAHGKYYIDRECNWFKIDKDNRKIPFEEIVATRQVIYHQQFTNKFLNEKLKRDYKLDMDINIIPVIVLANENLVIQKENSYMNVIHGSQLYEFIEKNNKDCLSNELKIFMKEIFLQNNGEPKRYKIRNYYKELDDMLDRYLEALKIYCMFGAARYKFYNLLYANKAIEQMNKYVFFDQQVIRGWNEYYRNQFKNFMDCAN